MNERELEEHANAAKESLAAAKDRAIDTAHDVGDRLQRGARDLSEQARHYGAVGADYARRAGSSTASFASENALPLTMIGLGVGWLVLGLRRNRAHEDSELYEDAYRSGVQDRGAVHERVGALATRAREVGGQLASRVGDSWDSARSRAGELGSQVSDQASQWTHDAREGLSGAGRRTVEYADENPLLLGAVAIAAGVGVGLALPATQREDEWLGDTRDRLLGDARGVLDEARDTARGVATTAREVARDVQRQATETKEELRSTVGEPRFSH